MPIKKENLKVNKLAVDYDETEIAARIHGYLLRLNDKNSYLEKHDFNEVAAWVINWENSETTVYGRFIDAIAYMVVDTRYFGDWINNSIDQTTNCNNARIHIAKEPLTYKLPKIPAKLIKEAQKESWEKLFNYIGHNKKQKTTV